MSGGGESGAAEAIEVDVELSCADVRLAHFWTLAQFGWARLAAILGLLGALASGLSAVSSLSSGEAPSLGAWLGVLPLVLLGLLALRVDAGARRHYASLPPEARRGRYVFTPKSFRWTLGREPGEVEWSYVIRLQIRRERVLLLTRGARPHVVAFSPSRTQGEALERWWKRGLRGSAAPGG